LEKDCSDDFGAKIQVVPAALTEVRAVIDQNLSAFEIIADSSFPRQKFERRNGGYGYTNSQLITKAQLPTAFDEMGSVYRPETQPLYGDSGTANLELEFETEFDLCVSHVKARIQPILYRILSSRNVVHEYSSIFRNCPAGDSSTSSNRPQGSPTNGPPRKRRFMEQGKAQHSQERDGNGGSDGGEDPNEQRERNKSPKIGGSRRLRLFACPFYQRDRVRYTRMSCQPPGYADFHRLK
jgi:hypothetical protein